MENKPLVNKKFLLEKFHGKGGWTYARIPEIPKDKHAHFGWVRVRGTIDDVAINHYNLLPMGNGTMMLPVRAEIRKKIGKQEGDYVFVTLYPDNRPIEIPDELLLCLEDDQHAKQTFFNLSGSEQKAYVDWIYSAKKIETRVNRIAKAMNKLAKGFSLYDPDQATSF